jgi:hypothetical protein
MSDRSKRLTELTATGSVAANDVLVVVADIGGTPATKKITVSNLLTNSVSTKAGSLSNTTPPLTSSGDGTAGSIRYDTGFVYVCVATNTWKRIALSDF